MLICLRDGRTEAGASAPGDTVFLIQAGAIRIASSASPWTAASWEKRLARKSDFHDSQITIGKLSAFSDFPLWVRGSDGGCIASVAMRLSAGIPQLHEA
jgi:hypothetical protein